MTTLHTPRRASGFQIEALDDERLLYHPQQTRAIYLNETATLVWALCDGRSVENILTTIRAAYPDAPPTLEQDIQQTLATLAEAGALTME